MAGLIRRLLREVYAALQAYGSSHLSGALVPPAPWRQEGEPAELEGPPPAHPERLCPEVALTPVERMLERELEAGA
jgi:hypothetical protein